MEWALSENKKILLTPQGIEIPMETEVLDFVPCGYIAVVLLNTIQSRSSNNVIAYALNGNMLWRFMPKSGRKDPFTSALQKGDNISLHHPDGYNFIVDLGTGKQIGIEQSR